MEIPFNQPQIVGAEHAYIDEALASGKLSGNGKFARRCGEWLEDRLGAHRALITPSCTAALEMTGVLAELRPGDEVIVPDFAFVSTANAFALLGATPVFVDIDPDTLNITPEAIEQAITERTRVVVVIHYGGIACDMERIQQICARHRLLLVEDAAHSIEATYRGRPLGSIGDLATFSFHETKNVQCGEGGALIVNNQKLVARAEIIQEKGTDRGRFFRGEIDKYTWQDVGSSYLLSEVAAAFLWAQFEHAPKITDERHAIWNRYYDAFASLEADGLIRRPRVPPDCAHSGHLFYMLLPTAERRDLALHEFVKRGVHAVFHYLPLHASPAGKRLGALPHPVPVTDDISKRLLRLPLWVGMTDEQVDFVIDSVNQVVGARYAMNLDGS
ncbi:MAG TPA: dTDP-4-amino-4,6-dideoxygalactose transaminase [Solirubrobacteraceae bacterium]